VFKTVDTKQKEGGSQSKKERGDGPVLKKPGGEEGLLTDGGYEFNG